MSQQDKALRRMELPSRGRLPKTAHPLPLASGVRKPGGLNPHGAHSSGPELAAEPPAGCTEIRLSDFIHQNSCE